MRTCSENHSSDDSVLTGNKAGGYGATMSEDDFWVRSRAKLLARSDTGRRSFVSCCWAVIMRSEPPDSVVACVPAGPIHARGGRSGVRTALVYSGCSRGAKRFTVEPVCRLAMRSHAITEPVSSRASTESCRLDTHQHEWREWSPKPVSQLNTRVPLVTPYVYCVQGAVTERRARTVCRSMAKESDAGSYDVVLIEDWRILHNPPCRGPSMCPTRFETKVRAIPSQSLIRVPRPHRRPGTG